MANDSENGAGGNPAVETGTLSGRVLGGRYRVGRLVGRGGMGAVYEAVQEGLGRRVAVKVLHDTLAEDRTLLERFRREAESAAALGHPNIVQVTDFVAERGEPAFLIMEYLVGRSLRTVLIDEGRVSPERIGFIAAQVLSALGAAHRAGIVHRDLKPDNIFLTSVAGVDDIVKLLDFGVAKLSQPGPGDSRLTLTGGLLGTPAYMAPEQARGDEVDARADLYAVGVILYQALAGKLPFDAPNPHKLLFAIIEQTPESLAALCPSAPAAFVALVERAMAKSRDARFQSAAEMAAALLPWARGATASAATPSRFVVRDGGVESDAFSQTVASIDEERIRPSKAATRGTITSAPTEISASAQGSRRRRQLRVAALTAAIVVAGGVGVTVAVTTSDTPAPAPAPATAAAPAAAPAPAPATAAAPAPAPAPAPAAPPAAAPAPVPVPPRRRHKSAPPAPTAAASTPRAESPRPRPLGGTKVHFSGGVFKDVFSPQFARERFETVGGALNGCFRASEFEPPDHQFMTLHISVSAQGTTTKVAVGGGIEVSPPRLTACLSKVLHRLMWGPTESGQPGTFMLFLTARTADNP